MRTLADTCPALTPPFPPPLAVPPPYVEDSHPLRRIQQAMLCGGNCDVCAGRVRVLLFTPCACLLCVDCASGEAAGVWPAAGVGGLLWDLEVASLAEEDCHLLG